MARILCSFFAVIFRLNNTAAKTAGNLCQQSACFILGGDPLLATSPPFIYPGYPSAHHAENLIVYRSQKRRYVICVEFEVSIRTHQNYLVAYFNIPCICKVYHALVHADISYYRSKFAVDYDFSLFRQYSCITVSITYSYSTYYRFPFFVLNFLPYPIYCPSSRVFTCTMHAFNDITGFMSRTDLSTSSDG